MGIGEGSQIGRFRVERLLGVGGFASVFLAHDESLDSEVAIKVLADNHSHDPELRERFLAEGRLLRKAVHPGLLQVYDVGETSELQPYLVLELAEGGTLADRLSQGRRPNADDIHALVDALTSAVSALHDQGIVHRDLSPSNIFIARRDSSASKQTGEGEGLLDPGEVLLVGDLGLAKDLTGASGFTVGAGSMQYASPEQRAAVGIVSPASDVYSASVLVSSFIDSPELAELSEGFRPGLAQGMRVVPEERPQTMREWKEMLYASPSPTVTPIDVSKRQKFVPLLFALLSLLVGGALLINAFANNQDQSDNAVSIYADGTLASGWVDMSWGAATEVFDPIEGTVQLTEFGALSVSTGQHIEVADSRSIEIVLLNLDTFPTLGLLVNDEEGVARTPIDLAGSLFVQREDDGYVIDVPISELDLPSLELTRVSLTEAAGESATFTVESIRIVK